MKNARRPAKKTNFPKISHKAPSEKELSEDQLEHVVGGAVDAFIKFGGVDDATTIGSATGGAGAGKIKLF